MILHRLYNWYGMKAHVRKKQGQKAALLDKNHITTRYNELKSKIIPLTLTDSGKPIYRFDPAFSELARKWRILSGNAYPEKISIFDKKTYTVTDEPFS